MNNYISVVTCASIPLTVGEIYNNETCTHGTKIYNDTCELSCTLGYNLSSSDGVRKCTENGTWSNPVTCERESIDVVLRKHVCTFVVAFVHESYPKQTRISLT